MPAENVPPPILALVKDLIFSSRITGSARQTGATVKLLRSADQLTPEYPGHLLLVDLNLPNSIEAAAAWQSAEPGRQSIGFVSHVDSETIARARAAGLTDVLPRSRFVERLPEFLENKRH